MKMKRVSLGALCVLAAGVAAVALRSRAAPRVAVDRRSEEVKAVVEPANMATKVLTVRRDRDYRAGGTFVRYSKIEGEAGSQRDVRLCQLVELAAGPAGLYRVDNLVGVPETTPEGALTPATYVELSLVEAWTEDAPSTAVARISGGPADSERTLSWSLSLSQGEVAGILFQKPSAYTNGFYGLHNLGVFRDLGQGATNGQLFTKETVSLGQLKGRLQRALKTRAVKCEGDIESDRGRDSKPWPKDDLQVVGQSRRSESLPRITDPGTPPRPPEVDATPKAEKSAGR
jgi:hypothetical protein